MQCVTAHHCRTPLDLPHRLGRLRTTHAMSRQSNEASRRVLAPACRPRPAPSAAAPPCPGYCIKSALSPVAPALPQALPDTIGDCTALVRLGLKSNRLAALPASIGRLHGLVELYLTGGCAVRWLCCSGCVVAMPAAAVALVALQCCASVHCSASRKPLDVCLPINQP